MTTKFIIKIFKSDFLQWLNNINMKKPSTSQAKGVLYDMIELEGIPEPEIENIEKNEFYYIVNGWYDKQPNTDKE